MSSGCIFLTKTVHLQLCLLFPYPRIETSNKSLWILFFILLHLVECPKRVRGQELQWGGYWWLLKRRERGREEMKSQSCWQSKKKVREEAKGLQQRINWGWRMRRSGWWEKKREARARGQWQKAVAGNRESAVDRKGEGQLARFWEEIRISKRELKCTTLLSFISLLFKKI